MRDPALLAWAFAIHAAAIQEHHAALDIGGHVHPEVQGSRHAGIAVLADDHFRERYANQIQSVRCYARAQGYDLWLLSGGEFTACAELWKAQNGYFFLKHCAAASLLQAQEPGYSLAVLDSDVVAAALDRSLDRWPGSSGITGEEVMAGNYIAKNRPWVRAFLQQWVETLELSGASRVRELYGGLEAKVSETLAYTARERPQTGTEQQVDNLQPYWSFVEASMRVLGPPRMWRLEQTSLGREHGCSAEADVLVMHHGIKDPRDVAEVYFSDLTQCVVNRSVVVTAQKMGQEGYSGLYPQGPGYSNTDEESARYQLFKATQERVDRLNKLNGEPAFGITWMADRREQEKYKRGFRMPNDFEPVAPVLNFSDATAKAVDWRLTEAVTPIKNQGAWSKGKFGCFGCDGGFTEGAYEYLKKVPGLANSFYIPYAQSLTDSDKTATCPQHKVETMDGPNKQLTGGYAAVTGYSYAVKPCMKRGSSCKDQDLKGLAAALEESPVSVCVNSENWDDYTSGVMSSAACGEMGRDYLDHCVMAVGFNANTCGVADDATIPHVKVDLPEAEAKEVAEKRAEMFRRATKAALPTGAWLPSELLILHRVEMLREVANFTCEPLAPDVALGSLSFVQEASETQATRRVRRHAALAVGADGTARALHEEVCSDEQGRCKPTLWQGELREDRGASRAAAAASAAALAAEEAAKAASAGIWPGELSSSLWYLGSDNGKADGIALQLLCALS
ncbi:Cysteine proteinase 7 [Symbiodinium microadriaticum]|uniref:Cysteine proteinase 7 n=1 Tax=Symbiodinium microadriaticum TaxID=2951 RepID=A0A1Q9D042_SYMMI|nr:Cysteine proteinase 7 [Symbiodinium microadriaticum]